MSVLILQGDARTIPLADESVHCVVTSPPFFASAILCYDSNMNMKNNGHFKKGERRSPATEFKKGETSWRPPQIFRERDYLITEYVLKLRSAEELANEHACTAPAITYWLKKHGIARRSVSETRAVKHWGSAGEKNPMFGRVGALNRNWRGGCTPERQSFYVSREWAVACSAVWKRDKASCRKCGVKNAVTDCLHVHHIVPFHVHELRAEPTNLVLLCTQCHRFVHSKKNTENLFIRRVGKEVE